MYSGESSSGFYVVKARQQKLNILQIFNEARKNVPSIIYIPNIDRWWKLASDTVKAIYLSQLKEIDPNVPILILAAADVSYNQLPKEVVGFQQGFLAA